jgi:hypothetical protein
MKETATRDDTLALRLFEIRAELFGPDRAGLEALAAELSLTPKTWRKYESGATMPAPVMVRFLVVTGATSRWLLTGQGERFFRPRMQRLDRMRTTPRVEVPARDDA